MDGQKVIKNIWERDMSVRQWAIANGFKPDTVYKLLEEIRGHVKGGRVSMKIIKRLKEQGLHKEASNG